MVDGAANLSSSQEPRILVETSFFLGIAKGSCCVKYGKLAAALQTEG